MNCTGGNLNMVSFTLLRYLQLDSLPYGLSWGTGNGFGVGAAETAAREAAPKRMRLVERILVAGFVQGFCLSNFVQMMK